MKKTYCDRCEAEIQTHINRVLLQHHLMYNLTTNRSYELCEECFSKLTEWLKKASHE